MKKIAFLFSITLFLIVGSVSAQTENELILKKIDTITDVSTAKLVYDNPTLTDQKVWEAAYNKWQELMLAWINTITDVSTAKLVYDNPTLTDQKVWEAAYNKWQELKNEGR